MLSQLPLARLVDGLDGLTAARLRAEMAVGFNELAWLYAADSRGELVDEEQLIIQSHIINPYFDLRLEVKPVAVQRPGRYTVRTRYSVMSLPADRVRVFKTP